MNLIYKKKKLQATGLVEGKIYPPPYEIGLSQPTDSLLAITKSKNDLGWI